MNLAFLDTAPNIFRILPYLHSGFLAYLFLGDDLAVNLRTVVDMVRHSECYLSPAIRGLYERYMLYRGVFEALTPRLIETFKLMGEGLSVQQIVQRTGLRPEVVYRRQYRLRQHFGVETNDELIQLIQEMYGEPTVASAAV